MVVKKKNVNVYLGLLGSGKNHLAEVHSCGLKLKPETVAFADGLREMIWRFLGWKPKNEDDYIAFKRHFVLSTMDKEELTGRDFLQRLGTECVRYADEDFWVRLTAKRISEIENDLFLVTDCRFENEIKFLLNDENIDATFYYCNYKNIETVDGYVHESEQLAVDLLKENFMHRQNITDFIKENYS